MADTKLSTSPQSALHTAYPWTSQPLIVSAPMRFLAGPKLVHAVSSCGGLGFLGLGAPTPDQLPSILKTIQDTTTLFSSTSAPANNQTSVSSSTSTTSTAYLSDVLPFGIGFLLTGVPGWEKTVPDGVLKSVISLLQTLDKPPAAIWLFPAHSPSLLRLWTSSLRSSFPSTKIWIQTGTVNQSLTIASLCAPDVLVIQGADAGGHGLAQSAGLVTLLPEVSDALTSAGFSIPLIAAGGISDHRSLAASLMLGASGVVVGTRFLASSEANIAAGYQDAVLAAADGGVSTVRTEVFDRLRITPWPGGYDGRAVKNASWEDDERGEEWEKVKERFEEDMKKGDDAWGVQGRATTYAGAGVGLVRDVKPAGQIVVGMREEAVALLRGGGGFNGV